MNAIGHNDPFAGCLPHEEPEPMPEPAADWHPEVQRLIAHYGDAPLRDIAEQLAIAVQDRWMQSQEVA